MTDNTTIQKIQAVRTQAELQRLNRALIDAVNSAGMLDDTEDGGTCNLDSVVLRISIPEKLAARTLVPLEKMLVRDWGSAWRGCYMVGIPLSGQANRRSRMAEAACNALNNAGYQAEMYYQMD